VKTDARNFIDQQDAQSLGWQFLGRQNDVLTARGYADFEIYQGIELFDGERFEVAVLGSMDLPEILIGLARLRTRRLVIDIPANLLTLATP
jgi:predicted aspartyl protease